METTLLGWPCYSSHTVCEECTAKIIQKNSACPFCRSVLPTTVVPKEESNDCKDDNDYQCEYECDYEYFEDGVDEEEKYFSKYRK
jgi:hypothetical protein